jgi:hypothetical protein
MARRSTGWGGRSASRSSRSRSRKDSRRASVESSASEESGAGVLPPPRQPSPRLVRRRDFKAQGRARSRAKLLRRMEEGAGGLLGAGLPGPGPEVDEPPCLLVSAFTVGAEQAAPPRPGAAGGPDGLGGQLAGPPCLVGPRYITPHSFQLD